MRDSLKPGLRHRFTFRVPASKTVAGLYPEAPEFQQMPEVFATGFLVGLGYGIVRELVGRERGGS